MKKAVAIYFFPGLLILVAIGLRLDIFSGQKSTNLSVLQISEVKATGSQAELTQAVVSQKLLGYPVRLGVSGAPILKVRSYVEALEGSSRRCTVILAISDGLKASGDSAVDHIGEDFCTVKQMEMATINAITQLDQKLREINNGSLVVTSSLLAPEADSLGNWDQISIKVTKSAEQVEGPLYVFRGIWSRDNSERLAFYIMDHSTCAGGLASPPVEGQSVIVAMRHFKSYQGWRAANSAGNIIFLAHTCK